MPVKEVRTVIRGHAHLDLPCDTVEELTFHILYTYGMMIFIHMEMFICIQYFISEEWTR